MPAKPAIELRYEESEGVRAFVFSRLLQVSGPLSLDFSKLGNIRIVGIAPKGLRFHASSQTFDHAQQPSIRAGVEIDHFFGHPRLPELLDGEQTDDRGSVKPLPERDALEALKTTIPLIHLDVESGGESNPRAAAFKAIIQRAFRERYGVAPK